MKNSILVVGIALLTAVPFAYGDLATERANGPCVRVTVQNDRVNESDVRQNCDRNASRTVQVGARNQARTVQTGRVNNNSVRQYHFEGDKYFPQRRHP